MEGKRILTTRAVANMVTAEDVYTSDNRLIIPENTVLTDEIINALKEYSVFAFRVKVGEDGRIPLIKDDEKVEVLKTLKQIIMSRSNETEIVVTQPDGEVWTYVIKYYENLKNSCVDAFVEDVEYMINNCGPLDEPHYYSNPGGWAMFMDKGNDIIDCDDENLVTFNNDGVGV